MDIAVNKTYAVFRTPFSETEDLAQAFSGIRGSGVNDQDPVDFFYAGLVRKTCPDIWHADRLLALSTDEAPPQVIRGADMGGNHALECAVAVETQDDILTVSDIGTLWRDEKDMGWTCLRLLPDGRGLFASENMGPSDTEYAFAEAISGSLHREDGALLRVTGQQPRIPMASCIRHRSRQITALKNGQWRRADRGMQGCDQARIREVYEIVNPVSAIRTLRNGRPPEGYAGEQSLALGDAMFRAEILHTICPDGTIVTDFDYQAMQPIRWQGFLALMYQEKCRPAVGSVRRYIPGLKPFYDAGQRYDFSVPRDIALSFPASFPASPDTWADPRFPPDRQIEQIVFGRSRQCVAFAAGILPVEDGRPEIRRENAADALRLVSSRKSYLTFCGSSSPAECVRLSIPPFTHVKGAVYRTYFPSDRHSSLYLVPHRGVCWLYADWMDKNGKRTQRTFPVPRGVRPVLHQLRGDVSWTLENGTLHMSGSRGCAVWALRPEAETEAEVAKQGGA